MGHADLDPAVHERRPWNAGQNVGPKRPLKPRDIWAIRFYLDEHSRLRDRALFDLATAKIGVDKAATGPVDGRDQCRVADTLTTGELCKPAVLIDTGRPFSIHD